jgi:hypothetical protein
METIETFEELTKFIKENDITISYDYNTDNFICMFPRGGKSHILYAENLALIPAEFTATVARLAERAAG